MLEPEEGVAVTTFLDAVEPAMTPNLRSKTVLTASAYLIKETRGPYGKTTASKTTHQLARHLLEASSYQAIGLHGVFGMSQNRLKHVEASSFLLCLQLNRQLNRLCVRDRVG